MSIEINGWHYEIVIGTDVARPDARNGAFIEMRNLETPATGPMLIAFRWNATGKITISMYREDVELEVLREFLRIAEKELDVKHWPLWGDLS